MCLEQLLIALLRTDGPAGLMDSVCSEPDVDIAASICLCCSTGVLDESAIRAGLESYVDDLRSRSADMLWVRSGLGGIF